MYFLILGLYILSNLSFKISCEIESKYFLKSNLATYLYLFAADLALSKAL